jgi:hypothetical protein
MANGNKVVGRMRLLRKAIDVIFRYHTNHVSKVSGRMCPCTICQDASLLFDEIRAHTRAEEFAKGGVDKDS